MTVGFNEFKESYVSKVRLLPKREVHSESVSSNLFDHLKSSWIVTPITDNSVKVDFDISFHFKSPLYAMISKLFLSKIVHKMMKAFNDRAKTIEINET